MKLALNCIHYLLYKGFCALHLFSNRMNPFMLLHKLPFQKRRYEKLRININKELNSVWLGKESGFCIITAGGILVGMMALMMATCHIILNDMFDFSKYIDIEHVVFYSVFSWIVCHVMIFRSDDYLHYFDLFEDWSNKRLVSLGLVAFSPVIGAVAYWIIKFI